MAVAAQQTFQPLTTAGLVWGLDGALRPMLNRSELARWLAGFSPERAEPRIVAQATGS